MKTTLFLVAVFAFFPVLVLLTGGCPRCHPPRKPVVTKMRVDSVAVGIEQLKSPGRLGWYPPTSVTKLTDTSRANVGERLGEGNDLNRGIECVFVALFLQGITTNIDLPDDAVDNTDGDVFPINLTSTDTLERREIVDAWGNPLAYFSSPDYEKPDRFVKIKMSEELGGQVVEARPWRRPKTGLFINPRTFQLFSAGPDAVFNTEDDIGNWVPSR